MRRSGDSCEQAIERLREDEADAKYRCEDLKLKREWMETDRIILALVLRKNVLSPSTVIDLTENTVVKTLASNASGWRQRSLTCGHEHHCCCWQRGKEWLSASSVQRSSLGINVIVTVKNLFQTLSGFLRIIVPACLFARYGRYLGSIGLRRLTLCRLMLQEGN